jgi:hypothetical protein
MTTIVQDAWYEFLPTCAEIGKLTKREQDRLFELLKDKVAITPNALAKDDSDWNDTLKEVGITSSQDRGIIKIGLRKLQAAQQIATGVGQASRPPKDITLNVDVDFSSMDVLKITGHSANDTPFPGFFVGFNKVVNDLGAFIIQLQTRPADSRPAIAAVVGPNKVGKTRMLHTVLPAYVCQQIPTRRFIFVPLDCENLPMDSAASVLQHFYVRITGLLASFNIQWESKINYPIPDDFEGKFKRLADGLNKLDYMVVLLMDEYQQLFQLVSLDEAMYVANIMKSFLYSPFLPNMAVVVSSSNAPVMWSCLSLLGPNGRDILGEMAIISIAVFPHMEDLQITKAMLVEKVGISTEEGDLLFAMCWNHSPGMYAFTAEQFTLVAARFPGSDFYYKAITTTTQVSHEIMQRIKKDYSVYLRMPSNDKRSYLWNAIKELLTTGKSLPENLTRRTDRLPLLQVSDGKYHLLDAYLTWCAVSYTADGSFLPINSNIQPIYAHIFSAIPSQWEVLRLIGNNNAMYEQFERMVPLAFGKFNTVHLQAFREKLHQVMLDVWHGRTVAPDLADWGKLAEWIIFLHQTDFGGLDQNNNFDHDLLQNWLANRAVSFSPMYQMTKRLRIFCAHAIEAPHQGYTQHTLVVQQAERLWGANQAPRNLLELLSVMRKMSHFLATYQNVPEPVVPPAMFGEPAPGSYNQME